LSRTAGQRTSGRVADLFDMDARAARRDRALRTGPVLFLHERAFTDILDRLGAIRRDFSSALLIGAPDRRWPDMLAQFAGRVTVMDPGSEFAKAAGGLQVTEDTIDLDPESFDLIVAAGTLDTVNDLRQALLRLRFLLKPDSLLIGVMAGGETLPRLRQAMRSADMAIGAASPHVHPRIEPAALAGLLGSAGFAMPVVDIDRVPVTYRNFRALVADLRGMGATNILTARRKAGLTRAALAAAEEDFRNDGQESRTTEQFELLHFAAWT
jgi:NADH dehydrogenase [ubiquinone] 1 alpha subcomplex assembly factor 5